MSELTDSKKVTYDDMMEIAELSRPTLSRIISIMKKVNEINTLKEIADKNGWKLE